MNTLYVYLFVWMNRFATVCGGGRGNSENYGNVASLVEKFQVEWVDFYIKNSMQRRCSSRLVRGNTLVPKAKKIIFFQKSIFLFFENLFYKLMGNTGHPKQAGGAALGAPMHFFVLALSFLTPSP